MSFLSKIIIYGFLLIGFCQFTGAQTTKQIEVDGNEPYVDHVSLMEGSTDMDLLVKFMFDEPNNSLKVSLISYRKLFVFQDNTRYSRAVWCFKLRPNKLSYVVESDEQARYKLTKALRKSIKPRRKHIFKRWIEYEGLQPQPTNYKMVNDYIEQKFDILYKEAPVSITLRDILVMNEQITSKKKKYDLFYQTDLNRKYEITIKRDPCFGKEEALQAAIVRAENIQTSFTSFNQKFKSSSSLNSPEGDKLFHEMKALLQEQFPKTEETSPCPEIQQNIDLYNSYVDSIQFVQSPFQIKIQEWEKPQELDLSADYILMMARKIDSNVNKWLLSSDPVEKRDLEKSCEEIINSIQTHVNQAARINAKQKTAIAIFKEAKDYYHRTCVKE